MSIWWLIIQPYICVYVTYVSYLWEGPTQINYRYIQKRKILDQWLLVFQASPNIRTYVGESQRSHAHRMIVDIAKVFTSILIVNIWLASQMPCWPENVWWPAIIIWSALASTTGSKIGRHADSWQTKYVCIVNWEIKKFEASLHLHKIMYVNHYIFIVSYSLLLSITDTYIRICNAHHYFSKQLFYVLE